MVVTALSKSHRGVRERATSSPTLSVDDAELLASFIERTWSELGLADNTPFSHRHVLSGFALRPAPSGYTSATSERETTHR